MKKYIIILSAILALVFFAVSCNSNADATNATNATDAPTSAVEEKPTDAVDVSGIRLSGDNRYRIIFPAGGDKSLGLRIYDKLIALDRNALSKPYTLTSDKALDNGTPEILIGLTNRSASGDAKESLECYSDFIIYVTEGKIAIFANTEERLADAVEYFISQISLSSAGDVIYNLEQTYLESYEGDLPDATVEGAPLKDFAIVLPSEASEAQKAFATTLSNRLSLVCGSEPEIYSDSERESANEIVLGKTERSQSISPDALCDLMTYADGKIFMCPADDGGYTRMLNLLVNALTARSGELRAEDLALDSLSFSVIKTVMTGVAHYTETEKGLQVNKCTPYQIAAWDGDGHSSQARASTGIRIDFTTDSASFYFKASVGSKFELFVNGASTLIVTGAEIDVELDNSNGENRITVVFPNYETDVTVANISIDEGASIKPIEYQRKFLILGDSITQGNRAIIDSLSYANRITAMFDANSMNQGIGGGRFDPKSIDPSLDFDPDYVFVAFGTNDWSWGRKDFEDFTNYIVTYFEKLRSVYPDATIITITPIWRQDNAATKVGEFEDARAQIAKIAAEYGAFVVDGIDLVPHESKYYGDSICLHPNDEGFEHYANNLYEAIKDIIK